MEVINKFINENGKMFRKENIKSARGLYIIFLVIVLGLLPFAGGFISMLGLLVTPVYALLACVYDHNVIKKESSFKKIVLSYFLLSQYFFIVFNLMIYSMPKLMGLDLGAIIILIITFEIVCMALGGIYTYVSIKKNKIKEYRKSNTLKTSMLSSVVVCWVIFIRICLRTTPITAKAFIYITTVAIAGCFFAFYMGKIFIPALYLVKKYNIEDFVFFDG